MTRLAAAVLAACALCGCATVSQPMAIDRGADSIDISAKSIVLFSLEVTRSEESRYVPLPTAIRIAPAGDDDAQPYQLAAEDAAVTADGKTLYLARIALKPGNYVLQGVDGVAHAAPVTGVFDLPLNLAFTAEPRSLTYLGRVSATLRPRKDGEFRAGPLAPADAQAASGISTSTWDVKVEAQVKQDVALFRNNYHVLKASKLLVRPLPAFDREAVQHAWAERHPDDK